MIQATVTGNVGKKVELKEVGNTALLEFTMASNAKAKGEDVTTWVRCQVWGARAAKLGPYITTGKKMCCVGSLTTKEYEKRDGSVGYALNLNVSELDWMSGKNG